MIIVSTQCFPPALGGIENLMYDLSNSLSALGERVVVFADGHKGNRAGPQGTDRRFQVFRYSGPKPWRRRRKAAAIRKFSLAHAGTRQNLVTDSWKSLEYIDPGLFSRVLCLAHGSELPLKASPRRFDRIRRCLEPADSIIANSHYTANRLSAYVVDPSMIKIIYPGICRPAVDAAAEKEVRRQLRSYGPVLITVARLEKRKGHFDMIRILPALAAEFPALLYIIAGDGTFRKSLEDHVSRYGVKENVLFTGRVDRIHKNALLSASDLFVMPGNSSGNDVEGFGTAYLEAASLGLPSVAGDTGGAAEAVLHNRTGLVCRPGDPQDLKRCVLTLLRDHSLRQKMGESARLRAKDFLWARKIHEYRDLLDLDR